MRPILFFLFFNLVNIFPGFAQTKLVREKGRVLLKNKLGVILDSIYYSNKAIIQKDTVWIFSTMKGQLPDRCPWSWFEEKKYIVKEDRFDLLDSLTIHIGSKCASLFHDAYCIVISAVRVKKSVFCLTIDDYESKVKICFLVNNFDRKEIRKKLEESITYFSPRKECPSVEVE